MDELLRNGFRLLLAIVCGAVVGWERASKRHSAGLRTFMVIMLGGTITMMLDIYLKDKLDMSFFALSAAAVIAISSVAVNSIYYSAKNQIKGLTTSASLWVCGIIGMLIGAGCIKIAVLSLLGLYLAISLMPPIEE